MLYRIRKKKIVYFLGCRVLKFSGILVKEMEMGFGILREELNEIIVKKFLKKFFRERVL